MNIALPTFILIYFLFPGLLFRKGFFIGEQGQLNDLTKADKVYWSIIPAFILHILAIFVISLFNYNVDLELLVSAATNGKSEVISTKFAQNIDEFKFEIMLYFIVLNLSSLFIGYGAQQIMDRLNLEFKYSIFRYRNKWYYIFSGEEYALKNQSDIGFIFLDILVSGPDGKYILYFGLFTDYMLDNKGEIETIQISFPSRRFLEEDHYLTGEKYREAYDKLREEASINSSDSSGNFTYSMIDDELSSCMSNPNYEIPSDSLLIPWSTIVNINFRYYDLEEIDQPENSL